MQDAQQQGWLETWTWGTYPGDDVMGWEYWPAGLADPKRVWQDEWTGAWCVGAEDQANEGPDEFGTFEEAKAAAEQKAAEQLKAAASIRDITWRCPEPDVLVCQHGGRALASIRRTDRGWVCPDQTGDGPYRLSEAVRNIEEWVGRRAVVVPAQTGDESKSARKGVVK